VGDRSKETNEEKGVFLFPTIIEDSSVEWEKISRVVIPPEFIQYLKDK